MQRVSDRIFRLYQPASGGLQILGAFQHYYDNLTSRHGIASLDINGNLQPAYANVTPASVTNGTVYAVDTQGNNSGQVQAVIGGDFTGVGGKFHQNLARLNPDGSVDDSFVSVVEGQVNTIRTLDEGQILVAGKFGSAQAYGCTGLVRLNQDGSLDTSFKPILTKGDGTVAGVRMTDTEDSGQIDIGGNFANIADASYLMQPRAAFARLNNDGTLDPSFNAQIIIPNGTKIKVNAGGTFGSGYAVAGYVNYLGADYGFGCCLNSDGSLNTTVGPT